jgi:hypothetical protein
VCCLARMCENVRQVLLHCFRKTIPCASLLGQAVSTKVFPTKQCIAPFRLCASARSQFAVPLLGDLLSVYDTRFNIHLRPCFSYIVRGRFAPGIESLFALEREFRDPEERLPSGICLHQLRKKLSPSSQAMLSFLAWPCWS